MFDVSDLEVRCHVMLEPHAFGGADFADFTPFAVFPHGSNFSWRHHLHIRQALAQLLAVWRQLLAVWPLQTGALCAFGARAGLGALGALAVLCALVAVLCACMYACVRASIHLFI